MESGDKFRSRVRVTISHSEWLVCNEPVDVVWMVVRDERGWGIASMDPVVPDQRLIFEVENEETEEVHALDIELSDVSVEMEEADPEGHGRQGLSLALTELHIKLDHMMNSGHGLATFSY